jgi:hypothetical protein
MGGKRPNFSVGPETGQWFCFSKCNQGGDIYNLEVLLGGGNFGDVKQRVFEIVGRPFPKYAGPSSPRPDQNTRISAELFRTGFTWRIERALATVKKAFWAAGDNRAQSAIGELTRFLAEVDSWKSDESMAAYEVLQKINPELVSDCVTEASDAQVDLARCIAELAGRERAA